MKKGSVRKRNGKEIGIALLIVLLVAIGVGILLMMRKKKEQIQMMTQQIQKPRQDIEKEVGIGNQAVVDSGGGGGGGGAGVIQPPTKVMTFRFARTGCVSYGCGYKDGRELPFEYEIERDGKVLFSGMIMLAGWLVAPYKVVKYSLPVEGNYIVRLKSTYETRQWFGVAEREFSPKKESVVALVIRAKKPE